MLFYEVNLTLTDFMEMGKQMLRQERGIQNQRGHRSEYGGPDWMRTEVLPLTNAVFDVPREEIDELFNF